MDKKNIIAFPERDGKWRSALNGEFGPVQMPFICHLAGFAQAHRIIETVSALTGGELTPNKDGEDILFLDVAHSFRQAWHFRSLAYILDRAVFSANGSPFFYFAGVFDGGFGDFVVSFGRDSLCLNSSIKNRIKNYPLKFKKLLEQIHNPSADPKMTEKFFELLEKNVMSFGMINPDSIDFLSLPTFKEQYVRLEWSLINEEMFENKGESVSVYSNFFACKYIAEDANSLEEVADRLNDTAKWFRQMAKSGKIEMSGSVQGGMVNLTTTDSQIADKFGFQLDEEE